MAQRIFSDDYEHMSDEIEYILENILQDDDGSEEFKTLEEQFNSTLFNGCDCENCEKNCTHGGNYVLLDKELVLGESRRCEDLIYECNDFCRCKDFCLNKLVQFGPRDNLIVTSAPSKGQGLFSSKLIPKGSFVCEYAGEILTRTEAVRRDQENKTEDKMNFVFCLNEINSVNKSSKQTFVDPSRKGNIGRYINHSCDPNCIIISTRVDSIIPKIAIFANQDIPPMTEITFNYGPDQTVNNNELSKKCLCASINCKLYLPNFSFY